MLVFDDIALNQDALGVMYELSLLLDVVCLGVFVESAVVGGDRDGLEHSPSARDRACDQRLGASVFLVLL